MLKKLHKKILSITKKVGVVANKAQSRTSEFTAPDVKVYNQIVNFAFNFPVNSIKYNNEYIWPYIRHHLLVQLTAVSIGNRKAAEINPFRLQLGNPDDFDLDRKRDLSKKYGFKFLEDMENEEPADFLFFTALNASEQIEIDSKIYYRIIDPLFEVASKIGSARKVEFIRNNSPAIKKTVRYFHRPTFIFSPHIVRSGYMQDINIKSSIQTYFKRYLPSIQFDRQKLDKLIEWEMHTRDFCLDLLQRLKPKVIFVPSFHYYAPMISAARELGIVSVDVQHGIQVGYNPLYNEWSEIPREGYQSIPNYFFVWGEKESENIENVFGPHSAPKIIGNLWLQKQIGMSVKLSSSLEAAVGGGKIVVLIAMQSQTVVPQLFKDIIEGAGKDFLWLVRMHPKGKKYSASDFSNSSNVIVSQEIDKLPIIPLLNRVQITLSEGSTIAVEGHSIGAAAFITSETGKMNYEKEISENEFFFIEDVAGFLSAAEQVRERRGLETKEVIDRDVPGVLKEVLAKYRPASTRH